MKYSRNKEYGIILTQIGTEVSEIWPNKLEVAQSLKRNIGALAYGENFREGGKISSQLCDVTNQL